MLQVTNGSSVSLPESGLGGEVLIWADVLHHAPVPGEADTALAHIADHEEVTLWFEHDLYDQIQLIHILDWFRSHPPAPTRLTMICIDHYLGYLRGDQLAELWPERRPVTQEQMDLAATAWRAFRAPDPTGLTALLQADTAALPFLSGALLRHLQQFPAVENGLARTERQILEGARAGHRDFSGLFVAHQSQEERIFMGDTTFRWYLDGLAECAHPLIQDFELTDAGRNVLETRADHVRLNGIDRWLGGVHLHGREARWRWNEAERRLA